jgi:tRNA(Ile2) C34 agmatinyltransferase TiaS
MEMIVICAKCQSEYKVSADEPRWKCKSCGHEAENRRYPFLTRRVAHAKSQPSETNWQEMFDEVLDAAHERVLDLEGRIAKLEAENKRLRGAEPERKA